MSDQSFQTLDAAVSNGVNSVVSSLVDELEASGDWHKLFDAKMLAKKAELGLPLTRPSSLQDVPDEYRSEVEKTYVAAARDIGERFIGKGDFNSAWMYLQVIREPEKLAAALDGLPESIEDYEQLEEILQIALYQGVNPKKGLQLMLNGHGTCSTITAMDQVLHSLSQAQRSICARTLVQHLYKELQETVRQQVETRVPMLPPGQSLRELILGRDWLFEGGNYHVDVSHLNSVVRFARSIEAPAEELTLASELALYGSMLERTLQYDGEPPFEDFYPAHIQFFNVINDQNRDEGLQYFKTKLDHEPDEQDKPLLAYVLVDLCLRAGKLDEAVDWAAQYLTNLSEDVSLSFDELCEQAGRLDVLKRVRQEQGDLVGYASALLREGTTVSNGSAAE